MPTLQVKDANGDVQHIKVSGAGSSLDPHAHHFQVDRSPGAGSIANGQVELSATAGNIVAARATRRRVTIKNLDASIVVYVGAATVTSGNGMPLLAGESISLYTTAAVQGIAASGTPTVAYVEEYD